MSGKKSFLALAIVLLIVSSGFSKSIDDDWGDFLHYTKIGQFEMAQGYAQAVLDAKPGPVKLLELAQSNPRGYELLTRANESSHIPGQLAELNKKILELIEQGRFNRRTNPKVIVTEIKRLNSTDRARIAAVRRLRNAGEYSTPHMLEAIADNVNKKELANILWALPQIGRDSLRPLTAALQTDNLAVKAEVIKAMGKIGYPQALAYLKYVAENDSSAQLGNLAIESIGQIEPTATEISAAHLFYTLAENYYYHADSLKPAEDAEFANVWFWDRQNSRLTSEKTDKKYFYELMAMRSCEWALRADPAYGKAIGLWLAAYFKAESTGIQMPAYFGDDHADASVYATTAGPEYLHQALERALKDKDAYVALGVVEALALTAGESSLFYRLGVAQPLLQALGFDDRAVRYSAAIAIAEAGPKRSFAESGLVIENLAEAISQTADQDRQNQGLWSRELADSYVIRAARAMLKLAQTHNDVIDLSLAGNALIDAVKDSREELQVLAGQVLAHLNNPNAQRAIAKMALTEKNTKAVRIAAFESLAISAKFNANLLEDEMIDEIYSVVSSSKGDSQLKAVAASAYGSLNLTSPKVKELVLDQARD